MDGLMVPRLIISVATEEGGLSLGFGFRSRRAEVKRYQPQAHVVAGLGAGRDFGGIGLRPSRTSAKSPITVKPVATMSVSRAKPPPHSWRMTAPVIESSEPMQNTGSE